MADGTSATISIIVSAGRCAACAASREESVMRKTILAPALAALALLWGATLASAQQFGTAAEARAVLDRAVTELKANPSGAIAKFNDKDNKQFHDRDLY